MKLESERMNDLQCHIRCARLVHSGFWLMHMFVRLGSAFWIFRRINLILENIGAAVVESIGSGSVCTSLCCFLFLGLVFVSEYFFFPAEEWITKYQSTRLGQVTGYFPPSVVNSQISCIPPDMPSFLFEMDIFLLKCTWRVKGQVKQGTFTDKCQHTGVCFPQPAKHTYML